jgi:hypothetical protein
LKFGKLLALVLTWLGVKLKVDPTNSFR